MQVTQYNHKELNEILILTGTQNRCLSIGKKSKSRGDSKSVKSIIGIFTFYIQEEFVMSSPLPFCAE